MLNNLEKVTKFYKFCLNGKNALITGAAGLLGIEHAMALLESGATVVLTDVCEGVLKKAKSKLVNQFDEKRIIIEVLDVSNPESIIKVKNKLLKLGIFIDILINNAAINPKVNSDDPLTESSRLENFSLAQWNLELSVGLTGAFLCSKIFGSEMAQKNKSGVILNIASDLSVISPDQRLYRKNNLEENFQPVKPITYSVIKSGLIGLTKYLSTYWAGQNIRVNALSPGGVFNNHEDEFVRKLSALVPLGRMANPDEYRAAIQFLCSDASSYMNGQNVVIDGGRSVW